MTRVVVYLDSTDRERQIKAVNRYCQDRGYDVVSIAEGMPGWASANAMVAAGEADAVVFASRRLMPDSLETVTAEIRVPKERRPKRL